MPQKNTVAAPKDRERLLSDLRAEVYDLRHSVLERERPSSGPPEDGRADPELIDSVESLYRRAGALAVPGAAEGLTRLASQRAGNDWPPPVLDVLHSHLRSLHDAVRDEVRATRKARPQAKPSSSQLNGRNPDEVINDTIRFAALVQQQAIAVSSVEFALNNLDHATRDTNRESLRKAVEAVRQRKGELAETRADISRLAATLDALMTAERSEFVDPEPFTAYTEGWHESDAIAALRCNASLQATAWLAKRGDGLASDLRRCADLINNLRIVEKSSDLKPRAIILQNLQPLVELAIRVGPHPLINLSVVTLKQLSERWKTFPGIIANEPTVHDAWLEIWNIIGKINEPRVAESIFAISFTIAVPIENPSRAISDDEQEKPVDRERADGTVMPDRYRRAGKLIPMPPTFCRLMQVVEGMEPDGNGMALEDVEERVWGDAGTMEGNAVSKRVSELKNWLNDNHIQLPYTIRTRTGHLVKENKLS